MINRHHVLFTTLLCLLVLGHQNNAHSSGEGLGVGVKAGTLGVGVELSGSLLANTRLRGGFNYLTYSFDSTISDINYDFETEFNSLSLIFDWHPFGNSFFLSGGAYFNNNSVSVEGSVDENAIPFSSIQYASLVDLVSISGDVEFTPVAPYAGLGWRSNNDEQGWGVMFELGVLFQGAPEVTNLRINAPIDVNHLAEVQAFLAEQGQEIEDDLSVFEFYPVATLMLVYNF